jgi:uncharacterized protein (DUF488 family)
MAAVLQIWTVGHSNLALAGFLALLQSHDIRNVADVRRFAGSRRYPHFSSAGLRGSLGENGISYEAFPELGGRRAPVPDSPNTAWRNAGFRGYADYMASADFATGIARLLRLAQAQRSAVMCAEALWWRCHRALIADHLKAQGIEVTHILSAGRTEPHPYTSAARIVAGRLSYAPEQGLSLFG